VETEVEETSEENGEKEKGKEGEKEDDEDDEEEMATADEERKGCPPVPVLEVARTRATVAGTARKRAIGDE